MSAVATGLSHGPHPHGCLIREALHAARARLRGQQPSSALLFMSPPEVPGLAECLRAAAREIACTQIMGAGVQGVMTEDGWVRGEDACAVMLFGAPVGLEPPFAADGRQPILSLAGADQLDWRWLQARSPRVGVVLGQGGAVWAGARPIPGRRGDAMLRGAAGRTVASAGLRQLTTPLPVTGQEGALLLGLDRFESLTLLAQTIPYSLREKARLPLERLLVAEVWDGGTVEGGDYDLVHIRATEPGRRGLWLERPLADGSQAFLVLRDAVAAERDTRLALDALVSGGPKPDFGWIFSSYGRGASFFEGADRDFDLLRDRFPSVPFIGACAAAEFATSGSENRVLRYSTTITVFRQE